SGTSGTSIDIRNKLFINQIVTREKLFHLYWNKPEQLEQICSGMFRQCSSSELSSEQPVSHVALGIQRFPLFTCSGLFQ
ncbi:hypothetical protein, partial [Pseudomonas aeruginosa]|uniref:hypothetical protein n=3 Tax=Pseudomonas aeruginosa TaxID=287 RepID=UPI0019699A36